MSQRAPAIKALYEERKKFIIIGLTGRTGSGCSTTAKLMTKPWPELKPPKPQSGSFRTNEERKYRIVFDFAKYNWKQFQWIQIRDIITSFILIESFDEFAVFAVNEIAKDSLERQVPIDKERAIRRLKEEVEIEFKELRYYMESLPKLNDEDDEALFSQADSVLEFYLRKLPAFSSKLKDSLQRLSKDSYTKVYQIVGDNIRSSGGAIKDSFSPSHIFTIAKSTNKLIKVLRHLAKREDSENLIVIDAIRNPFEATFFHDRYAAFYLLAVNCPNDDRIKRLQKSYDYSPSQVQAIDKKEYDDKPEGNKFFVSQNIKRCIEMADIYFPNPSLGEDDLSFLTRQLVWYISLIMHPGLVTPTSYEHAMQIAYSAKLSSGCISRQVGAVVTDQNLTIKAVGWNNTPQGQVPCILRSSTSLNKHDDKAAYSDYENNNPEFRNMIESTLGVQKISPRVDMLQGRNLPFCFKDIRNCLKNGDNQVHTRSLHAEENAFLMISKHGGQGLKDGILFTTASPCELCSKKAYQLGITEIYYIDPYPGISNEHVLRGGNKNPKLTLFSGAIGKGYHRLFEPLLPYKDELEMLLDFKWPSKNELEA
ncbi:MAG: hypothetical protein HY879_12590, partial [Deltaproteobacteria bacterium]|nr:hypothetical protein [Deltaproteobacteria bacterium]